MKNDKNKKTFKRIRAKSLLKSKDILCGSNCSEEKKVFEEPEHWLSSSTEPGKIVDGIYDQEYYSSMNILK